MKYLKMGMVCFAVNFVASNQKNEIVILLLLAAILFPPNESEAKTSH